MRRRAWMGATLLPRRDMTLRTQFGPPACQAFLRDALDRSLDDGSPQTLKELLRLNLEQLWWVDPPSNKWCPFSGEVSGQEFTVRRLMGYSRRAPMAVAKGRLIPVEAGTEIRLTIAPNMAAQITTWGGLLFWLLLWVVITVSAAHSAHSRGAEVLPLVGGCVVFGVLHNSFYLLYSVFYVRSAFAKDEPLLLSFLRSTLRCL